MAYSSVQSALTAREKNKQKEKIVPNLELPTVELKIRKDIRKKSSSNIHRTAQVQMNTVLCNFSLFLQYLTWAPSESS